MLYMKVNRQPLLTTLANNVPARQALSCAQPQQMLQVTLNHLETVKKMVPNLTNRIDTVIEVGVPK